MNGVGSKTTWPDSLWLHTLGEPITPNDSLERDLDVDAVVVGGGFSGLWTAYYLKKAAPDMRIVVVEKEFCGYGASGRNGGWVSALTPISKASIAKSYSRSAAVSMGIAMISSIDEIERIIKEESLDADFVRGGTLSVCRNLAQVERASHELSEEAEFGFADEDLYWLNASQVRDRVRVSGALGGLYTPHCARIHPLKLVRSLAKCVQAMGVVILEGSEVTSIESGLVKVAEYRIRAEIVVRALEAYVAKMAPSHRDLVPVYSLVVATEQLGEAIFKEIGWDGFETLSDGRNLIIYAQRSADGRIVIGGRGAPYRFGSKIDPRFDTHSGVKRKLLETLVDLFPQLDGVRLAHHWGGPLGVPRDWFPSLGFDPRSGVAWAQGYAGDGVTMTNLAGRTISDLVLGIDSELTRLPWVNRTSPKWEVEPLRWLGINGARVLTQMADKNEAHSHGQAWQMKVARKVIGR